MKKSIEKMSSPLTLRVPFALSFICQHSSETFRRQLPSGCLHKGKFVKIIKWPWLVEEENKRTSSWWDRVVMNIHHRPSNGFVLLLLLSTASLIVSRSTGWWVCSLPLFSAIVRVEPQQAKGTKVGSEQGVKRCSTWRREKAAGQKQTGVEG